jgi:hypothetical protein
MRFGFACLAISCFIFLTGCGGLFAAPPPTLTAEQVEQQAKEAKKATEAAQPTATVVPTPLPSMIVSILGDYMLRIDPLDRLLETHFEVMDAWYGPDANGMIIFRLTVNCDGLCSRDRTFAVIMEALRVNLGTLSGMLPAEIVELQIITLNRMQPSGMVVVRWKDVTDYCYGVITDSQLVGRIVRP